MESIILFITMGFVVEAIVETLKRIIKAKKIDFAVMLSLVVGILCAITFNLDIFLAQGYVSIIPFMGVVLTGILISRGGNFISDLMSKRAAPKEEA